jgi:hypothetical protein
MAGFRRRGMAASDGGHLCDHALRRDLLFSQQSVKLLRLKPLTPAVSDVYLPTGSPQELSSLDCRRHVDAHRLNDMAIP